MDVLSSCIERLIICGASITNVDFHIFSTPAYLSLHK